jgi:hypothetical protein
LNVIDRYVSVFVNASNHKIEHNGTMRYSIILILLFTSLVAIIRPIAAARDENVPLFQTATVDNDSPNYLKNGVADWHTEQAGYRFMLDWTYSNRGPVPEPNTVYWLPSLTGNGLYEIEVYVPEAFATTTNARYIVLQEGQRTLRVVNQLVNNGRWVPIGTFFLEDTGRDGVYLDDVTYEAVISMVAFDAIRFIPADSPLAPVVPTLPAPQARVNLFPNTGKIGSIVTAYGSGFLPGARVRLLFGVAPDDAFMQSGSAIAGRDGTVTLRAGIPNVSNPLYVILQSADKTTTAPFIVTR